MGGEKVELFLEEGVKMVVCLVILFEDGLIGGFYYMDS